MKILWVRAGALVPLDSGSRIRTWNILRELGRWNQVTVLNYVPHHFEVSPNGPNGFERDVHRVITVRFPFPRKYSFAFYLDFLRRQASVTPYSVSKLAVPAVLARAAELLREGDFDVLVCDYLDSSPNIPPDCPCPQVLFQHNVETLIWKRHYEVARSPVRKALMGLEYRKMRTFERRRIAEFDHLLAVSNADRDYFVRFMPADRVSVVPTGVDVDYFHPQPGAEVAARLVFSGSMNWMGNEDAILYFAEAILPLVSSAASAVPGVTLTVAGREPRAILKRLAERDPRVRLTGTVPDIRPYLAEASVYVVPVRVGSGTRLKIFEAMAMGKAVVSTRVGAEGLAVKDGEHLLLADEPKDFAQAVVRLLSDEALRRRIGQSARQFVERHCGWSAMAATCHDILERVATARREKRQAAVSH